MQNILRFEFDEPYTVKSSILLKGRGIRHLCTQLDGTQVYRVTEVAETMLKAKYAYTYTNDNNQTIAG